MSRKKQFEEGTSNYFSPQYDSDEDLPDDARKEIKKKESIFDRSGADKLRKESWEKADMYPKIKRVFKGMWSGDKHKDRK
jgi:hypothetical protein